MALAVEDTVQGDRPSQAEQGLAEEGERQAHADHEQAEEGDRQAQALAVG